MTAQSKNVDREKSNPYMSRQQMLRENLEQAQIDALILNPSPSLIYFTGLHFHLSERPIIGIFTTSKPPILVLPELESAKTEKLSFPLQAFTYAENPETWQNVFKDAISTSFNNDNISEKSIAIEPRRLRYLELQFIQHAAPDMRIVSGEEIISALRMYKDEREIMYMRKAVEIAQTALDKTLPIIKVGVTERQIANELTRQLLNAGSDPAFPFSPIVSGGPNSANPHATPTDRPLREGDLLVIDWGASYNGYISDITRTFAIGNIDDKLRRIAQIVQKSNEAGRSVIKPGLPACDVDKNSRSIIEEAGYGEYFIHRTGHGIGMEGHEPPYIRDDNRTLLEVGMTFTVEPGIYLPGRGGVRIEDDMLVTQNGGESLTNLPRELKTL